MADLPGIPLGRKPSRFGQKHRKLVEDIQNARERHVMVTLEDRGITILTVYIQS